MVKIHPTAAKGAASLYFSQPCREATIGSGRWDCAHLPSHTTGRAVFRIRRLNPAVTTPQDPMAALAPSGSRTSLSVRSSAQIPPRNRRWWLAAAPPLLPLALAGVAPVVDAPRRFQIPLAGFWSPSSSSVPWFFGPSLHRRYAASSLLRPLLTASPLSRESSPQVRCRICPLGPPGSTQCVLDDFRASLLPASSPPAPGLSAGSCSCGRRFATRFFQLRLTATLCVSLRLSSSTPSSSFHLDRFCPCWAHWRRL